MPASIGDLLAGLAPSTSLTDADGTTVAGSDISALAAGVTQLLCAAGVRRGVTVAVGLPLGITGALGILGVARRHVALPLSPDAPVSRLTDDLAQAAAVVVATGPSNLRTAAGQVPVIELPDDLEAWPAGHDDPGEPGGSVLLQSSGTTGRPHLAALTHATLLSSAASVVEALQLTPADRTLALMPLFHAHGLAVTLLAPLLSGGSVVFAPNPADARSLMDGVTWWSAAPTVHQELLRQHRRAPLPTESLRALRCGSAALTPALRSQLESAFGCPVIEAYGLTETGGPIASELLGAGPGMRLQRSTAATLSELGELLLQGPALPADEKGWFATGDLATIGADGSITLTGRRHDVINRGGESVNPERVDAVLARHPGVAAAAAYAVPHATLGQSVAAAVVLLPHATVTGDELLAFAGDHLSFAESPRQIAIVSSLPVGPTGKVDRRALAETAPAATPTPAEPDQLADEIRPLMAGALERDDVGVDEDFFTAGGDSLSAVGFITAVEDRFHVTLDMQQIVREPLTCARLAERISQHAGPDDGRTQSVHLNPDGTLPPLFLVFTSVASLLSVRGIGARLGPDRPLIGLVPEQQAGRLDTRSSVRAMARALLPQVTAAQPTGPILLAGHSFGGRVAHELACQLIAAGRTVALVVLIDTRTSARLRRHKVRQAGHMLRSGYSSLPMIVGRLASPGGTGLPPGPGSRATFDTLGATLLAVRHRESPLPTDLHLLTSVDNNRDPSLGWRGGRRHTGGRVGGRVHVHPVPGDHLAMLQEPQLAELVGTLSGILAGLR